MKSTSKAAEKALEKGGEAYNTGDFKSAIINFTKAIKLDPKNTESYNHRAITYCELEKYTEAIADYTKVIEMDPKDAAAYSNRGNAYSSIEKYTEAIAD